MLCSYCSVEAIFPVKWYPKYIFKNLNFVTKNHQIKKKGKEKIIKNPAYGRHKISQHVQILALIQKIQKKKKKDKYVTFHVSCVTCHYRQQPQPTILPLLNPPLCTAGWFIMFHTMPNTHTHACLMFENKKRKNTLILQLQAFCIGQKSPTRTISHPKDGIPSETEKGQWTILLLL